MYAAFYSNRVIVKTGTACLNFINELWFMILNKDNVINDIKIIN